jgi:hypothetical protein
MTRTLLTSLVVLLTLSVATAARANTADGLSAASASAPAAPTPTARPAVASSEIESRLFGKDPGPRPKALLGLYASLGVLTSLDLISTHKALANGAVEANPALPSGAGMQLMVKTLTTVSTIAVVEQMWKRNKMAAIVTMIAANGLLAAVSLNNMHNAAMLHK